MADSSYGCYNKFLNPWVLHFQKMGLELKCPLCLDLLNQPILLSCNHIFCSSCLTNSSQFGHDCFVCKSPYSDQDLRPASHMKNLVAIYRSMDAIFSSNAVDRSGKVKNETLNDEPVQDSPNIADRKSPVESLLKKENGGTQTGLKGTVHYQMTQTLPDSPPSFGEMKDSDEASSGTGDRRRIGERFSAKGVTTKVPEDATNKRSFEGFVLRGEDNCSREIKRQKLDFGSQDVAVNGVTVQSIVPQFGADCPAFICAFCQTSKPSEGTGPMMHYVNGKSVSGEDILKPNVLHVHRNCVDWAPKAYFDEKSDTVKNLKSEVARGAKLKCSVCGLKGAALGCYLQSCKRTYHAPCALKISGCRWDTEEYHMLCPSHTKVRFPSERGKIEKKLVKNHSVPSTPQMVDQETKVWAASVGATSELVLCGSALNAEEKNLMVKFAKLSGITISKVWKPNVTHVIASTDETGACSRTLKYLMAILNGKWVVKIDWVKACIEAMNLVNEEPYEVTVDIHGCQDGPKNGRLRVIDELPKLFNGVNFYFTGDFVQSYKESLENLIQAAEGRVVTKDALVAKSSNDSEFLSSNLVVYSLETTPDCEEEEKKLVIEKRRKEAEALGEETGSWVIDHTWILESIAACKCQPVDC